MFLVQLACQHTTEESMLRLTLTYHVTEGTNRHAHTQNLINHMLDVLGWTTEGSTTLGTKPMKFMLHGGCLHPEQILGPDAARMLRQVYRRSQVVMLCRKTASPMPIQLSQQQHSPIDWDHAFICHDDGLTLTETEN